MMTLMLVDKGITGQSNEVLRNGTLITGFSTIKNTNLSSHLLLFITIYSKCPIQIPLKYYHFNFNPCLFFLDNTIPQDFNSKGLMLLFGGQEQRFGCANGAGKGLLGFCKTDAVSHFWLRWQLESFRMSLASVFIYSSRRYGINNLIFLYYCLNTENI